MNAVSRLAALVGALAYLGAAPIVTLIASAT
jgi:hypothetical protein